MKRAIAHSGNICRFTQPDKLNSGGGEEKVLIRDCSIADSFLPAKEAGGQSMEYKVLEREERFMTIRGGKSVQEKSAQDKIVGEAACGTGYTVADIEALPEGERAELIDGELFRMASPTLAHQEMLGELWMQIRLYIKEHKGPCKVMLAPFAVYIKDDIHNYVEPDISVVCDREKLDEKGCHGAPDWVIEIVSPSSKYMDYVRKLSLYEEAGVCEYWIVDAAQRMVTVYDFAHKKDEEQHTFSEKVKAGIYEDLFLDFGEWN